MSRSSASAIIHFALLTIPVKLYTTASSQQFSFNLISPEGNRCAMPTVDAVSKKEYKRSEFLKGVELDKGNFVTFTDEELNALTAGKKNNTIEIAECVKNTHLHPLHIEKSYYLNPDKGAEKSYRLFSRSLYMTDSMAVGRYFARGKDHFVFVAPYQNGEDGMILHQAYYENELNKHEYSFSSATEPDLKTLELGKKLVRKMTNKRFDATAYSDLFAERLRAAIEVKRLGNSEQASQTAAAIQEPVVSDLEALLMSSVDDMEVAAK